MPYKKKYGIRKRSSVAPARKYVKKAVYKAKKRVFARKVKTVVNKMAETKVVNTVYTSKAVYNVLNSANFQGSILIVGPGASSPSMFQIAQGVGQGGRIGNKITTVKCMVRGDVRINTYTTNTNNYNPVPGYVTLWIVKLKPFLDDDVATLKAVIDGSFFQSGSGSVAMSGTLADLYRQVNTQQITVLKRRTWKIGTSYVPGGAGGTNGDLSNQYWANNDFKQTSMFRMDITKCLPKTLLFNDTNDNFVNRHSYMFFTFVRTDNAIPSSSTGVYSGIVPAYCDIEIDYMYKDM